MITARIHDVYANEGPQLHTNTYAGVGHSKNSTKRALAQALDGVRTAIRKGGEWAASGTPVLLYIELTKNGKTILQEYR